jgi:hypothetical protein
MSVLVWVEHEAGAVKDATLSAVTAAASWATSICWSPVRRRVP